MSTTPEQLTPSEQARADATELTDILRLLSNVSAALTPYPIKRQALYDLQSAQVRISNLASRNSNAVIPLRKAETKAAAITYPKE